MRAIPFRILQYTDVMACIDFIRPFTENGALNDTLLQYELPVVSYSTIESDGYGTSITRITDVNVSTSLAELNVREIRPPRMDDSGKTKYPVLFQVYVASIYMLANHIAYA